MLSESRKSKELKEIEEDISKFKDELQIAQARLGGKEEGGRRYLDAFKHLMILVFEEFRA